MRADAAAILSGMGYVPFVDFDAHDDSHGGVLVVWKSASPQPTEAEIDAAALPALKARTIDANRAEAGRRILAKYPDARQRSAAIGVYPPAYVEQMAADIAAVVAAENTAADLIDACTTEAQVAAVTVNWPSI